MCVQNCLVTIEKRSHSFPSRTGQWNASSPMIVRVRSCESRALPGFLSYLPPWVQLCNCRVVFWSLSQAILLSPNQKWLGLLYFYIPKNYYLLMCVIGQEHRSKPVIGWLSGENHVNSKPGYKYCHIIIAGHPKPELFAASTRVWDPCPNLFIYHVLLFKEFKPRQDF